LGPRPTLSCQTCGCALENESPAAQGAGVAVVGAENETYLPATYYLHLTYLHLHLHLHLEYLDLERNCNLERNWIQ
jgi:hypothetical protein